MQIDTLFLDNFIQDHRKCIVDDYRSNERFLSMYFQHLFVKIKNLQIQRHFFQRDFQKLSKRIQLIKRLRRSTNQGSILTQTHKDFLLEVCWQQRFWVQNQPVLVCSTSRGLGSVSWGSSTTVNPTSALCRQISIQRWYTKQR